MSRLRRFLFWWAESRRPKVRYVETGCVYCTQMNDEPHDHWCPRNPRGEVPQW